MTGTPTSGARPRARPGRVAPRLGGVTIDLNGIRLRNRLLTSASLLGYGASKNKLILYGLSPIAQWVPLERFGAVTTRTLTLEPRAGHFTLKEDWSLGEFPEMLRLYGKALHKVDAGWLNAFGWSNIGIERYFDEYFGRTANLNRIISVGGFSADEIEQLFETVNSTSAPARSPRSSSTRSAGRTSDWHATSTSTSPGRRASTGS